MGVFSGLGHSSLLALHVSIIEHLLPADVLLLDGPQSLLLFPLLLEQALFYKLLVSLVEDGLLLIRVESLEVIGLNTVRGKHGLLCGWVFCHEIVSSCVEEFLGFLLGPVESLLHLCVSLLFGEQKVLLLGGYKHGSSLSFVLFLGLLKELVEVDGLLIEGTIIVLSTFHFLRLGEVALILDSSLLIQLLLDPLLLLLLLELDPLFLHYITIRYWHFEFILYIAE